MVGPAPIEKALQSQTYDVYSSDADLIAWRPDLIRDIPSVQDKLEARVHLETDEFGFRNPAPLPEKVDIVVLGRSYSLGAQVAKNWAMQLAYSNDTRILNLSQPGGNLRTRILDLKRFGLPREPQWVILEIIPRIDMVGYTADGKMIIEQLPAHVYQSVYNRFNSGPQEIRDAEARFPIQIDLGSRTYDLTCCLHYVNTFSVNKEELYSSASWNNYQQDLKDLVNLAQSRDFCTVLLFAPGKADVYFPLGRDPHQFASILLGWMPLTTDKNGELISAPEEEFSPQDAIENLYSFRQVLAQFALQEQIAFIDPTESMQASAQEGISPFIAYDSHLNEFGHSIIADQVEQYIEQHNCP